MRRTKARALATNCILRPQPRQCPTRMDGRPLVAKRGDANMPGITVPRVGLLARFAREILPFPYPVRNIEVQ